MPRDEEAQDLVYEYILSKAHLDLFGTVTKDKGIVSGHNINQVYQLTDCEFKIKAECKDVIVPHILNFLG